MGEPDTFTKLICIYYIPIASVNTRNKETCASKSQFTHSVVPIVELFCSIWFSFWYLLRHIQLKSILRYCIATTDVNRMNVYWFFCSCLLFVVVIAAAAMQSFLQHAIFFAWIKWISNNTADDVGNAMLLLYVNWGCRGWCLIFICLSFVLFVCSECRCYDYMVMMTYKRFSFDCQLLLMSTNTTWIVKTSDNFKILQISYDRTKFNLFFFFLSIEYFCSRWQNYTWIYRFHVVKALC